MKGSRHKHHDSPGINLSAIITPFLDMSFQILAFFIMTYHPSALEGHIPGSLVPPSEFAKKSKDNNNTPPPMEDPLSVPEDLLLPELAEAVQVKIKAVPRGQVQGTRQDGEPDQILVKQGSDINYQVVIDTNMEFSAKVDSPGQQQLLSRLKEIAAQPNVEKANIKIEGDGDLKQQYVMIVYDLCKKAGFSKVHFVPPPLGAK